MNQLKLPSGPEGLNFALSRGLCVCAKWHAHVSENRAVVLSFAPKIVFVTFRILNLGATLQEKHAVLKKQLRPILPLQRNLKFR